MRGKRKQELFEGKEQMNYLGGKGELFERERGII